MNSFNFDKVELIYISFHHDDKYSSCGRAWYLTATYRCENEAGIYEVVLPQIELPIPSNRLPIVDIKDELYSANRLVDIHFRDGVTLHPVNTRKDFMVCKEV